jgi:hypothetical protein
MGSNTTQSEIFLAFSHSTEGQTESCTIESKTPRLFSRLRKEEGRIFQKLSPIIGKT